MPDWRDEALAAALEAERQRISDQARVETEDALDALIDAFARGRWGSWWCRFSEPTAGLRRLADLGAAAAPYLVELPQAAHLVGRLGEVIADMAVVVVVGERTSSEAKANDLQELMRVKDDFLRLTIHELRGPLGRVTGYLTMIREGDFGEATNAMGSVLEQLLTASREMSDLLDGLATLVRLQDRAEVLDIRVCRLGDVISAAIEATADEANRKGTRVEQDLEDPDLQLSADAARLRIALVNLIGNAVKYGPTGSAITVQGFRRSTGVAIAVSDEGPGVDPAEATHLFEAHRRGRNRPPEAPGGLGLGLYLVRRIVELHGGVVTVESAPGQGSRFTILLPTQR